MKKEKVDDGMNDADLVLKELDKIEKELRKAQWLKEHRIGGSNGNEVQSGNGSAGETKDIRGTHRRKRGEV